MTEEKSGMYVIPLKMVIGVQVQLNVTPSSPEEEQKAAVGARMDEIVKTLVNTQKVKEGLYNLSRTLTEVIAPSSAIILPAFFASENDGDGKMALDFFEQLHDSLEAQEAVASNSTPPTPSTEK